MTDMEKVLNGLKCCLPPHDPDCDLCPYDSIDLRCRAKLHADILALLEVVDVTPEELERLKLCRHECKVDCLLEHYNKVVEERDALRMKHEALDTEAEEAEGKLKDIWDYATVNEIGWMQSAASDTECTLRMMAGELFRLKQPKVLNKYDLAMAAMANDSVYVEMRDRGGKGPYDDRWALLSPNDGSLNSREYRAVSTYLGDAVLIEDYYNKIWRCWDKRPTEEQKRRETWND